MAKHGVIKSWFGPSVRGHIERMTYTPLVSNVLSVYSLASGEDMREGLSWYLDAHNYANILTDTYDYSLHPTAAAGVIAALSPMMGWEANKRQAALAFERGNADGLGLKRNCDKANAILDGALPLDVLGGNKVRAFFSTILDPYGYDIPVIDRHAFDIAVGMVTDDAARSTLSRKGVYQNFGEVYVDAAKTAGVSASQMQAITWVAWRKIKNA